MRCDLAKTDAFVSQTSPDSPRWMLLASAAAAVVILGFGIGLAAGGVNPSTEESIEARRERLSTLSAEEREELRAKKERFDRMPPDEQGKIREFHERISSAPDHERLVGVMDRYNEWLKTLSPGQRADLLAMPADKRIEEIRKIRRTQEDSRLKQLASTITSDDAKAIFNWLGEFVERNRDALVSQMSPEKKLFFEESANDPARRRRMLMGQLFWSSSSANGEVGLKPTKDDVDRLAGSLSPGARKALDQLNDNPRKLTLIREWVGLAIAGRVMPEVDEKELEQFYQSLTQSQRDNLDRLPRDQMYQELKRQYVYHKIRHREGDSGKGTPFFNFGPGWGRGFGPPRGNNGPGDRKWEGRGERPEGRGEGPDRGPGGRDGRGDKRLPGPRPDAGPTGPPPGPAPSAGASS